jgi:hypothetical protein
MCLAILFFRQRDLFRKPARCCTFVGWAVCRSISNFRPGSDVLLQKQNILKTNQIFIMRNNLLPLTALFRLGLPGVPV